MLLGQSLDVTVSGGIFKVLTCGFGGMAQAITFSPVLYDILPAKQSFRYIIPAKDAEFLLR